MPEPLETDYLVIGSGIAGLNFALLAAEHGRVVVITKKRPDDTNTNWAQGGVAAVLAPDDSLDLHVQDTLTAGDGLCDRDVVEMCVQEGPAQVHRLHISRFIGQRAGRPKHGHLPLPPKRSEYLKGVSQLAQRAAENFQIPAGRAVLGQLVGRFLDRLNQIFDVPPAETDTVASAAADVAAEGVHQFQIRYTGDLKLAVDNQLLHDGKEGDYRQIFLPVALAPGLHRLRISAKAGGNLKLQLRYGGRGTQSLSGEHFRHP